MCTSSEEFYSETYKGYAISIHADPYAENPREFCEPLATLYLNPRAQNHCGLGDKDAVAPCDLPDRQIVVSLPVFLLDHSGLHVATRSFSWCDPGEWDSGLVGAIYLTRERVLTEFPSWKRITRARRAKLADVLQAEIKLLDSWLSGMACSFVIEDQSGEIVDSCGGFMWDEDGEIMRYVIEEARRAVEDVIADCLRRTPQGEGL